MNENTLLPGSRVRKNTHSRLEERVRDFYAGSEKYLFSLSVSSKKPQTRSKQPLIYSLNTLSSMPSLTFSSVTSPFTGIGKIPVSVTVLGNSTPAVSL